MTTDTTPLAPVRIVDCGDHWCLIVVRCPYCGNRHTHGGGREGDDPRTFLGYRATHCTNTGQYRLVEEESA